mmetsp:Transcript_31295/g.50563  ORF Transcript_31295/g.50563 Transcript_31295/m.50563 type:complete len:83 (-) Transcript_31295:55-303(-)
MHVTRAIGLFPQKSSMSYELQSELKVSFCKSVGAWAQIRTTGIVTVHARGPHQCGSMISYASVKDLVTHPSDTSPLYYYSAA